MSESSPSLTQSPSTTFAVAGITKVYHMGEVEVHALKGVDLNLYEGELTARLTGFTLICLRGAACGALR